jgi:hypothetical protein
MTLLRVLSVLAIAFISFTSTAHAESIISAQYTTAVTRYGHFALGRPHEYARISVVTDKGRKLELQLPEDQVFEDRTPRLARLAEGEPTEVLTIVSRRYDGSRLVMLRVEDGGLQISAESPATGTPNRWMNPVGVADLDGDGRSEIAAVTTPHIGGTLRVYQRRGQQLVEVASLAGFSNHVNGTLELGLSRPVVIDGRTLLLVPDAARQALRIAALEGGKLVEVGRCAVPAPVTDAIKVISPSVVSVGLVTGRRNVVLADCLRP